MLPPAYELPAAILLILTGAVACVAGYRLFRLVLGVYGFIFGAMMASSVMGITNTVGMIGAALVGGLVGALIMVLAWFVGVALVGATLGALLAHLVWAQFGTGDPPAVAIVVVSVAGAVASMVLQRYVVVTGTAFGGAWTMIVGAVTLMAARGGRRPPDDVWILYPMTLAPEQRWLVIVWLVLGLIGTGIQLRGGRKKKSR
ncbi:MAG: TMEM198/TM7SF3 family protein [Acidimicrobiia bacterium]|nr:TMEM198/TM7SF3 family protein [Acidimicrobiia bacterium]